MSATGVLSVSAEAVTAVDLTEADAATAQAVTDNNILKNSVATYGTAATVDANTVNTSRLYDGVVGGIHGVDGNPDPLTQAFGGGSTANEDSKYLYFTFDLGETYALEQFLLAFSGDSSSSERYGIRELYVWVGNDTAAQVIAGDVAPLYGADYGLRAVKPVLLTFNEKPLGRYLVLKMRTSWTGNSAVLWLSEIAAVGNKVPGDENTVRVVTVGDSITYGTHFVNEDTWSTAQYPDKYAQVVVDKLNAQNDGNTYCLTNLAISGSAVVGNDVIGTSDSATSWYNQSKDAICHADILTIMLGSNDAGYNWSLRKPLYADIYKQIVADFRAINPDLKLYILTSPYSLQSPHKTNLTEDIVPMQKALAAELDATLIDVFYWSKLKVECHGEASFIDEIDIAKNLRVHPHEAGHRLMGDVVYAGITGTELPASIRALETYAATQPVVATDLTEADAATAEAVTDNNILKNSVATYGTAATVDANAVNTTRLYDGVIGGIHGVDGNPDPLTQAFGGGSTANEDSKYLYFTFDLGETYALEQFLLAFSGDSSSSERYGIRELYVWVGNDTAAQVIAGDVAPLYGADYGLRAVKPVLLTFNEKPLGRYLVLKMRTSWTGNSAVLWLSEIAATGAEAPTPDAPLVTLGSQLRDPDATDDYALRFAFPLSCSGIDYAQPDSDTDFARAPLTADSKVMLDGRACTVTDFGALVSVEHTADFTLDDVGEMTKQVPAVNLYEVEDGVVTYTVVVTQIPAAQKDAVIYARPYVVTEEGVTLYGDVLSDSVSSVLEDVVR